MLYALLSGCQPATYQSSADEINIIPEPVSVTVNQGVFEFTPATVIIVSQETASLGEKLKTLLAPSMGFEMKISEGKPVRNSIRLVIDTSLTDLKEEGYRVNKLLNGYIAYLKKRRNEKSE